MAGTGPTPKIQVVDGQGQYLAPQVEQFAHDTKLAESKGDYQVVAIMGPQSSGKSTLLNNVFGTSFVMMDALSGRSQTTKGIWLSKSEKVTDNLTLVMDLEGNDGRERGEDDANFERQIALFALAVADVLLINIWCHDIGRETAAGKPLLRTIFQVNLKLFAPEPNRKRTVLLFVIRDKSKTPMSMLSQTLADDLNQMWNSIAKPAAYQDSKISDFFEVQYAGMSHYEERQDDFLIDAAVLRRRFSPDGEETLVRAYDHLPGAAFALSIGSIWDTIRQQKDLNLPAHKIMVANIRCAEIARDQLAAFTSDQAWEVLQQEATGGGLEECAVLPGFNARLTGLMDSCIQGYEEDALYFDVTVRAEKLAELQTKLAQVVTPVVFAQTTALQAQQLGNLRKELLVGLMGGEDGKAPPGGLQFTATAVNARSAAVAAFKKAFNENLRLEIKGWEGKEALAAFETAADSLISALRTERIRDATNAALKQLNTALTGPIMALLDACPQGVWPKLRGVTSSAAENAVKTLLQSLSGFALSAEEQQQLVQQIRDAARTRLEGHVREAAQTRLSRMKDRFSDMFTQDANKSPRMWRPHENIPAIAREARLAAAQLLAQLATIRPAAGQQIQAPAGAGEAPAWIPDTVELAIMRLARQDVDPAANKLDDGFVGVVDLMSVASWPDVDETLVLVAPHEARTTWRDFMTASNAMILQANATQEANRQAGNRMPPLWAIMAMLVLGWNEAVALVWNPVYLIIVVLLMLFGYNLYQELDVESEMSRGSLPGVLSLATKIGPAVRNILKRTQESLQGFVENPGERLNHMAQMVREMELPGIESTPPAGGSARRYVVAPEAAGGAADGMAEGAAGGTSNGNATASGGAGISGVSAPGLSKRSAAGTARE